jgi:predicted alpha-1,6-mannanase (GH76 family)
VLGLEVELAARTNDARHPVRVRRLIDAIADNMAPGGVIQGAGGGDGGLFNGILARYLALAATQLPEESPEDTAARATAKELVLKSAQSAWDFRQNVDGLPLFGAFWDRSADLPRAGGEDAQFVEGAVNASEIPEKDMSVQVSGWMLMEAAYTVADETPDGQLVLDVPAAPE